MTFSTAEINDFFDTGDNAVSASYYVCSDGELGDAVTITIIGKTRADALNPFTGENESNPASCLCKTSDIPAAKPEDRIKFGGVTYRVTKAKHNGVGFTSLDLVGIDT